MFKPFKNKELGSVYVFMVMEERVSGGMERFCKEQGNQGYIGKIDQIVSQINSDASVHYPGGR